MVVPAVGLLALCACGSGAEPGKEAVVEEATAPGVVTIETDDYVLGPGEEAFLCQSFGDPFGKGSRLAHAFASKLGSGGHHVLLFYSPLVKEPGRIEKCASFEFAPTAYGAQEAEATLEFPPGVAVKIPEGQGIRVQAHYLNPMEVPVTVRSTIQIQVAEAGSIDQLAGTFFVQPKEILVPAHSRETITQSCTLPFDVNVVAALAHTHKFGVGLDSSLSGQRLLNTALEGGVSATAAFNPPRFGRAGSEASVACHYENPETFDVHGGESFATEEMCILSAYYYPLPAGVPGTIDACNPGVAADPMDMD